MRVSVTLATRASHRLILRLQGVFTGPDEPEMQADAIPRVRRRIKEYGSAFSERAQAIVQNLQGHPDLGCRFLGIRLSFSDFYKSKKEQQKA
jgi:gamma-tubulin complex component 3